MKSLILILLILFAISSKAEGFAPRYAIHDKNENTIANHEYSIVLNFENLDKKIIISGINFFEKPTKNSLIFLDLKTDKPYDVNITDNEIDIKINNKSTIKYKNILIASTNDLYINNKPLKNYKVAIITNNTVSLDTNIEVWTSDNQGKVSLFLKD